jgi:uncharacterized protein YutE (UPF0331/DUF86 family)
MPDDVVLAKAATIEKCLARVREVHAGDDDALERDLTKQDSVVLNLQRACQAAIDLAMHLVRKHGLAAPQESRDAFRNLVEGGRLETGLGGRLERMVGFRNVAIHDYQRLDLEILKAILRDRLVDLETFARSALRSES